ncbi:MAG: Asp-tRNA(Asn)/Glu-tRNA(Gln) amidotransferase subunit GatC [Chloroflexi bacterium]|nr:Asp-tRNA(Asn)/Glu-tRNA(Gln) amidotransferase subunit GatC [Chloroflexota bacterium]MQC48007.1 Asp-tRNA(Asn)/Glu-tRNA(Gln) amidotransferase subunit GatC [Chloroflexota bacterium]
MALTTDEVRHIARLARLALTDDEVERYREQLSGILAHCEALSEIDTSDVPPTAQSLAQTNITRPDDLRPSLSVDAVLANAPREEDGYLRVRAVLD